MRQPIDYIRPASGPAEQKAIAATIQATTDIARAAERRSRASQELARQQNEMSAEEQMRLITTGEQGAERVGSDVFGAVEAKYQLDQSNADLERRRREARDAEREIRLRIERENRRTSTSRSSSNNSLIFALVGAAVIVGGALAYNKYGRSKGR